MIEEADKVAEEYEQQLEQTRVSQQDDVNAFERCVIVAAQIDDKRTVSRVLSFMLGSEDALDEQERHAVSAILAQRS